jgi:hypothetical protein
MAGKSAGMAVVVITAFLTPAGSPQGDHATPSSSPNGPAIGQLVAVARDAAAEPPGLLGVLARRLIRGAAVRAPSAGSL